MFGLERLGHAFQRAIQIASSSASAFKEETPLPTTDSENTWVYVWNLTAQKVGHTAIQVGGAKPKMQENTDKGVYMSIHPGGIPAIGPTTVLPLPASLANTLTEDMASKAAAQQPDACTESMNGFITPASLAVSASSLKPDHVFKIQGLNTRAMRERMRQVEAGVEEGGTAYQLLPRVNALGFLRALPAHIAQDPVEMALMREQEARDKTQQTNVYNCATLVESLLETGGMPPVKHSFFPWDPTPNDITEHLLNNNIKPI